MTTAKLSTIGAYALFLVVAGGAGDARSDAGLDIVTHGNGRGAIACNACHGDAGAGNPALGYPRLAGMPEDYTVAQLDAFAAGGRSHPTMAVIAKAMSPEERAAVAAYFQSARAVATPRVEPANDATIARGATLAKDGAWSKGLPACSQCHGPDGRGVAPAFPPLAGQSEKYLKAQLDAWRQGKRTADPLHLMTAIASKLDDDDVAAVAAYYASLAPQEGGEKR